ncbi:AAA family ATPase [Xenorhabdus nematophila]|uniref:ParA family protein n=1 Tax=Xenorhabdus nematophila TaxID=628 RepID=UPI0032B77F88
MSIYSFWNNKGGTGKTSLAFQAICSFAKKHPNKRILVVDLCPQANISELFLGGQENHGNNKLLFAHKNTPRKSIGGYFDNRLSSPYSPSNFAPKDYILTPSSENSNIPDNVDLICGDPLVELQAIAMNTLANVNMPGINSWLAVIDWLKDLLVKTNDYYDDVFIDTNPSFAMYTQIALAASEYIIVPVMADDSSRRALQNALSLIYGISLPSPIYSKFTFSFLMNEAGRTLPKIHLVVRNRITQYMGDASAYQAVLTGINDDLNTAIKDHKKYFSFNKSKDGIISVRDFQTTGVVAFARGCPFSEMKPGKLLVNGKSIQVSKKHLDKVRNAISELVEKI